MFGVAWSWTYRVENEGRTISQYLLCNFLRHSWSKNAWHGLWSEIFVFFVFFWGFFVFWDSCVFLKMRCILTYRLIFRSGKISSLTHFNAGQWSASCNIQIYASHWDAKCFCGCVKPHWCCSFDDDAPFLALHFPCNNIDNTANLIFHFLFFIVNHPLICHCWFHHGWTTIQYWQEQLPKIPHKNSEISSRNLVDCVLTLVLNYMWLLL